MIGELIFAIVMGCFVGYIAGRLHNTYDEKKMMKDIPQKIERQIKKDGRKFYASDGKNKIELSMTKEIPMPTQEIITDMKTISKEEVEKSKKKKHIKSKKAL